MNAPVSGQQVFSNGELSRELQNRGREIHGFVDSLPSENLLRSDIEELITHVQEQFEFEEFVLHADKHTIESFDTSVDVTHQPGRHIPYGQSRVSITGVGMVYDIPISGPLELIHFEPFIRIKSGRMEYPNLALDDGQYVLRFVHEVPIDQFEQDDQQWTADAMSSALMYVDAANKEIREYNGSLAGAIRSAIQGARDREQKKSSYVDKYEIPIKRRGDAPNVLNLEIRKRKLTHELPAPAEKEKEIAISEEMYEHILGVIRYAGRSFEEAPRVFQIHPEEELRDILLAFLNMYFEGNATGETFRKRGKLDIRIIDEKRSAFVAECKFYEGEQSIHGAIDQLLKYTTWRDCKGSIILFNKDRQGFKELQQGMSGKLENYGGYIRNLESGRPNEWRILVKHETDPDRQVTLHVFLIDLHLKKGE